MTRKQRLLQLVVLRDVSSLLQRPQRNKCVEKNYRNPVQTSRFDLREKKTALCIEVAMHSNAVNHYEHGRSLIALQLRCTPGMIWHQVPRCGEKKSPERPARIGCDLASIYHSSFSLFCRHAVLFLSPLVHD